MKALYAPGLRCVLAKTRPVLDCLVDCRKGGGKAIFCGACLISSTGLAGVQPANAETTDARVLVVVDESEGQSSVAGALRRTGLEQTTTIVDNLNAMERELAETDFDLLIVGSQRRQSFAEEAAQQVDSYVDGGGKIVATSWTGTRLPQVLEAQPVSENDVRIHTDRHPIFQAASMSEVTIELENPGWSVFSRSWEPLGDAQGIGQLGDGSAVVLGNDGRTAIIGPLFDSFEDVQEGERFVANVVRWILTGGASPPEIATGESEIHSPGEAVFSGQLETPGDMPVDLYVEVGMTPHLRNAERHSANPETSSQATTFSYRAENLDSNEEYYYRAVGISRAGHVEGETRELDMAAALSLPNLSVPEISGLWEGGELLGVAVSAAWDEAPAVEPERASFEYVPAGEDFADAETVAAELGAEGLEAELRGLREGEAYHVRATAELGDDRSVSAIRYLRLRGLGGR